MDEVVDKVGGQVKAAQPTLILLTNLHLSNGRRLGWDHSGRNGPLGYGAVPRCGRRCYAPDVRGKH